MTHTITLKVHVTGLTNKKDAHEWALSLGEHIIETFNDDNSITSLEVMDEIPATKKVR